MANRGFNYFFIFVMSGYYCRAVIIRMRSLLLSFFSRPDPFHVFLCTELLPEIFTLYIVSVVSCERRFL